MGTPPQPLTTASSWQLRLRTLAELGRTLTRTGRWWTLPLFVVLGLLGFVLTGLQAVPYVAPFIYAVF